jgi:predicted acyl esterase
MKAPRGPGGNASARGARTIGAFALAAVALLAAAPAAARATDLFGGDVECVAQPSAGEVRLCSGPTASWDGTKIDVDVILPPAPESGSDGPYPLIGDFHGWGGEKIGLNPQTQSWAEGGYAVFSMSDRGWGGSCGASDPDRLMPECAQGYNHLMDDRYEVRDAQYLISLLADEGFVEPKRVGATGMSYGGGISMALAALRNRTMLPDGTLTPWRSPGGLDMELAAAVPQWPWTDLAYSLMPNGRTLDYVADAPYLGPEGDAPIGIEKASYVSGLYGTGLAESNYAPPGTDPQADLTKWYAVVNAGEPYDQNPEARSIVEEITAHHSSYYIDHSEPPAPLLIQNGWNDDLFPVDEAIRFYNRTRTQYPGDPISLYLMDDGHARSQNKQADAEAFESRENAWFDHYLKGVGPAPGSSVEALTTVCGGPSAGPYSADSWKDLAPGEIRFESAAAQTIVPGSGDPSTGRTFDPIAGGGACATASGGDQQGVATYRLPPAPEGGYTLMGSPTVVADVEAPGGESEIAARLLDVSPEGTETLIARGLLRPGTGGTPMVFQLHPQAFHFAAGDVPKLELLPSDAPYARPSNAQAPVTVSNLELRLPVHEQPGAGGGVVQAPADVPLPPGYQAAIGYRGVPLRRAASRPAGSPAPAAGVVRLAKGRLRATRRKLLVRLRCSGGPCAGTLVARVRTSRRKRRTLARGGYSIAAGRTSRVGLPLTRAGRRIVRARLRGRGRRRRASVAAKLRFRDSGSPAPLLFSRRVHLR